MWLMSNRPAAVRTALCSSMMVGVLHRHVPAGEIDHAGAVGDVPVVKRRAQRHGKILPGSDGKRGVARKINKRTC